MGGTLEKRKSAGSTPARPSGRAIAGKTKRKLERQESRERTNRHEDAKHKLSIADKKELFETHNKKVSQGSIGGEPKPKRPASEVFTELQGINEEINESDDDVLVIDDNEVHKTKTLKTNKHGGSKENFLAKRQT